MNLFHEIYGVYYKSVSEMLRLAVGGRLTEKDMKSICDRYAFTDSHIEIISAIKGERWKLIRSDMTTPLRHEPNVPLTSLELSWLKAVSLDKRMKLFDADTDFLSGVEPLFLPEDYVVFEQYGDGDPFEDEHYIEIFRTLLKAVRERKKVTIEYNSSKGTHLRITGDPYEPEYSEKDDKFRIKLADSKFADVLNLAGIEKCEIIGNAGPSAQKSRFASEEYFIAELIDERNALERFMMHFSHFRKEATEISENKYRIKIFYDKSDETELVIRVLSFGQFIKITEPQSFVSLIRERLIMQKRLGIR
ncbi:MAG: WYL domain-containing protein [Oscillospiraceae bacterium]|nr:WYL domain-containing protein [Oscillospiraceae bacterium]